MFDIIVVYVIFIYQINVNDHKKIGKMSSNNTIIMYNKILHLLNY